MNRHAKISDGFTLIELIMVVVIIAVLSAIIVPNFVDYVGKSEASSTKANLQLMRTAIQAFRSDNNGNYPANDLSDLAPVYLPKIPPEGINDSNLVFNTQTGAGGWYWDTTTKVLVPNLNGSDAFGTAYSAY